MGENVNWNSHYGEQYGVAIKKLKLDLPHDPAIPLLGTYSDKTLVQNGTCTPVFIVALFTIAKTWKQPRCLLTDDWINKMWCV